MSAERPSRSALIVANDEYADPRLRQLRAPVRDAEALGRVLADPAIGGFTVDVVLNEPEYRLRRKLSEFFAERARDDLLLVHFSCHGLKDDDGSLYFATPDSVVGHLDSTAVSSEFVNRQMRRSRSRRIALFLDCCYSGAFSRGASARAGDGLELAERFDGQGQVVITASTATEYAFEGDELTGSGTPSVFTTAIVEGLESGDADRDGDGLVSIDELYDFVYDRVRERTPSQTPSKWTYDLQGELYVARNRSPRPAEPAELPADLRHALENRLAFVRVGAVSELEVLLGASNRRLAAAARAALEVLTSDDSRSVSDAAAAALRRHAPTDAPVLQPPVPLPAGERVRAVVMPAGETASAPAVPGLIETPAPAPADEPGGGGPDDAATQPHPRAMRRLGPRLRASLGETAVAAGPEAVAEPPAPIAGSATAGALRTAGRSTLEAVVLALAAVVLLFLGWRRLDYRDFALRYGLEGLGIPALALAAAAALLRSPRRQGLAAGAMVAFGVQGAAFSLSTPRADSYILDRLDQKALLLIGYGLLALAGVLAAVAPRAAEPALTRGGGGRPARVPALATLVGAVLLLGGISVAWAHAENAGGAFSLYHNEAGGGRLGLLVSLGSVAVAAGLLGLRRVPRPRLIAGAVIALGLQVLLHFGYLSWQIGALSELYLRGGTLLGLTAGVVIALAGLLALRRAQASPTPRAETTS